MFPIRDHNPSNITPYVSYSLIAINILVWLSYGLNTEQEIWAVYQDYALVPIQVMAGEEPYTFLTSMFMHAGFMHLAGNMLFLFIFGDNLEDYLGHFGLLVFYIFCGLGATFAQIAVDPSSVVHNLGASGAIAGLMGGYLILFPKAKVDVFAFFMLVSLPAFVVLGAWIGLQVFDGFGSLGDDGGGVAYWAHIGGFVVGVIAIMAIMSLKGKPRNWPEMPNPEAVFNNPWVRPQK